LPGWHRLERAPLVLHPLVRVPALEPVQVLLRDGSLLLRPRGSCGRGRAPRPGAELPPRVSFLTHVACTWGGAALVVDALAPTALPPFGLAAAAVVAAAADAGAAASGYLWQRPPSFGCQLRLWGGLPQALPLAVDSPSILWSFLCTAPAAAGVAAAAGAAAAVVAAVAAAGGVPGGLLLSPSFRSPPWSVVLSSLLLLPPE